MPSKSASPLRLFITLLALIFLTEAALMVALEHLIHQDGTPLWVAAAIDATLLTIFTSAFVWRLFMRPLNDALVGKAARARAVTDAAVEGIIIIDAHGIIETFNPAAERMFGYSTGEVIGKNVNLLMPEPHAGKHDSYLARYLRTGEGRVIGRPTELTALRKDRTEFPIELNLTEIRIGSERCFTGIIRDVTERKLADARIQHLAHYDGLTDLPNRALFYDRLRLALSLAKRNSYELALLYLDLDGFKAVNDTLGHDAGDELLKSTAARIKQLVRESDTVARIGGDEFTVILPRIPGKPEAAKVAEKIIDAMAAAFTLSTREQGVRVGVSIGIALYPADAQDMDALVKAADTAMYDAKRVKNSYRFFSQEFVGLSSDKLLSK